MLDSRDKKILLGLAAVGLIVRLLYFIEYKSLIEFFYPSLDALFHHLTAKSIAAGSLVSSEPFFRAPLYNYFLGFIYWLTGDSIALARFIQLMIGTLTAPIIYLLGKEVFDRRVGLIAAVLVLFTNDIVYFDGELLLESSATWLILGALSLLVYFVKYQKTRSLVLMSFLVGLAVIDRPNAIVLIVPIVIALWDKQALSRIRVQRVMIFAAVMMIPVTAVLVHNATRTEPSFGIATQGGINFYVGNNAGADGVSAVMPNKLGSNWQYADIKFLAETDQHKDLSPSEVSSYYFGKGLEYIVTEPLSWIKLQIKKCYLLFSGEDISNNRNLPAFKNEVPLFRYLPVGMGLLGSLGLVGMFMARKTKLANALSLFVVLYGLSFIAFFINSRFRLPLLPLLAIFSAFVLVAMFEQIREKRWPAFAVIASVAVILLTLFNVNLYGIQFDNQQQAQYNKGNLYLESGDLGNAIQSYYRALDGSNDPLQVHLNLGIAFLRQGETDSAWNHFLIEDSLSSGSAEALNNLAYLYRQAGQSEEALVAAAAAMEEKPYLREARLNYWHALREMGDVDSVYRAVKRLGELQGLETDEKFILAVSATDLRRYGEADSLLHSVISDMAAREIPRYSEASDSRLSSLSLAPSLFESRIYYNLGVSKAGLGQIDSAITFLDKAVELDHDFLEAWINLGSAYFSKQDLASAVGAFENALRLSPKSQIALFNAALAYYALGETEKAVALASACAELYPDFGAAKGLLERISLEHK